MEKLSDLMPQHRQVDDVDEELQLEHERVLEEERFSEDIETLQSLGAPLDVGGIELPEPTTGAIALLDIIQSPFIGAGDAETIDIHDIYKAIYILSCGKGAVKDVFVLRKCREKLERAEKIAETSPDFFAVFTTLSQALAEREADFEVKCYEFAQDMGLVNIEQCRNDLEQYIGVCFGGFSMLPNDDTEKKTEDLV